jgi:hypothetical protein
MASSSYAFSPFLPSPSSLPLFHLPVCPIDLPSLKRFRSRCDALTMRPHPAQSTGSARCSSLRSIFRPRCYPSI